MSKTKNISDESDSYVDVIAFKGIDDVGSWLIDFVGTSFWIYPEGAKVLRDVLNEVIKEQEK